MAYTDNTTLAALLGISGSGDNSLLTACITRAQAAINKLTGRVFECATATTRYFDVDRDVQGRTLYLDRDLCSISTITNGDGSTIASDAYVTEPRNDTPYRAITLKASKGITWTYLTDPENAISVNGKWAYSATAPDDIVQACLRLAGFYYRQKDNPEYGRAITEAGIVVEPNDVPADVLHLLAPYVRRM